MWIQSLLFYINCIFGSNRIRILSPLASNNPLLFNLFSLLEIVLTTTIVITRCPFYCVQFYTKHSIQVGTQNIGHPVESCGRCVQLRELRGPWSYRGDTGCCSSDARQLWHAGTGYILPYTTVCPRCLVHSFTVQSNII